MFQNLDAAFDWVESFTNLEKDNKKIQKLYRPQRMEELLNFFSNPHKDLKVIHLAGSKGKGSTAALLSYALEAAEFKCGLYTSPHVLHYKERIQVQNSSLTDTVYIDTISYIKAKMKDFTDSFAAPTTFEILTLCAFLIFKEEACDYCVIETGLGGRLDATNTVDPVAVVLTPIELEHTQWLGNTIEGIAFEKAGIIKDSIPVFSFKQIQAVKSVFQDKARTMNSPLFFLDDCVTRVESKIKNNRMSYSICEKNGYSWSGQLKLLGHIQAWNASLAMQVLRSVCPEVKDSIWINGFSKAYLPARMEVIRNNPLLVLDGSHTEKSTALALACFEELCQGKNGNLLFACQDDKDSVKMARQLAGHFQSIMITKPGFFKESHPDSVYEAFKHYHSDSSLELDPVEAFKKIQSTDRPLLIMGSFFLAGEIKKYLIKDKI